MSRLFLKRAFKEKHVNNISTANYIVYCISKVGREENRTNGNCEKLGYFAETM
jgi:hypothetical protein